MKTIQVTDWKKSRCTEHENFLRFEKDLNFSRPWFSEIKVQIKRPSGYSSIKWRLEKLSLIKLPIHYLLNTYPHSCFKGIEFYWSFVGRFMYLWKFHYFFKIAVRLTHFITSKLSKIREKWTAAIKRYYILAHKPGLRSKDQ